jgi:ATP-dependent exoDNAse (exonuclease V) beta subunit
MREATESLRAESEYGKLCTAYVAMTRSKFALYVLTSKLATPTTAKSFARLLRLTLSDDQAFVSGHADWYDSHPLHTDTDTEVSRSGDAGTAALPKCIAGTPHPVSPSSLTGKQVAKVAEPEGDSTISLEAADLGTEVHELLSRIEWDTTKIDLTSCSKSARELLEIFLKSAEAEEVFSKPGEDWILWNEKPFDLMAGGKWISGIFDRVHIWREGGKAVEARIYDYKTNRSTPEAIAQQYEGQMEQYRLAAAKLLGITIDKVSAQTVPIRQS